MSNVSVVTPYEVGEQVVEAGKSAAECAAQVVSWLTSTSEVEAGAVGRHRELSRQDRVQGSRPPVQTQADRNPPPEPGVHRAVHSVHLATRNVDELVRTASSMGYRRVPAPVGQEVGERTRRPQAAPRAGLEHLAFERDDGARIAITTMEGRTSLHASRGGAHARELVREHVIRRAAAHFEAQGLAPRTRRTTKGEVEIIVEEEGGETNTNPAEIRARVVGDGRVRLDVDCKGNKCEQVAKDFAEGIDGSITQDKRKDRTLTLPGESTKVRGRV